MDHNIVLIQQKKKIALVAHDYKKQDLLEWARYNKVLLGNHELYATGTTGRLLEQVLGVAVNKLQSGPLGGDQEIGAMIARGEIDFMIFFWDPLSPQPHDTDVKALLRIAVVWNIPIACNRSSADFMISSTCMEGEYERLVPNYDKYRSRTVEGVVAVEQPAVEQPAVEPPAVEQPAVEQPAVEPPAVEPPAVEQPAVEPPATEANTDSASVEAAVAATESTSE